MQILHCFADEGVESEALCAYGDVVRVGLDPRDTNESQPIKADANALPFKDGATFDLGLFHPPCQRWSSLTHIHGDPEDHPNLIPLSREIAQQHCDEYIIENVPRAPLKNKTLLNGRMFGLPITYTRAFETSYHTPDPPFNTGLDDFHTTDATPGDWNGSKNVWKSIKGYSGDYTEHTIKREAIPRAYIDYLLRPLLE